VAGNLTQLSTSVITTSIVSLSGGSLIGTVINVTGVAFFQGTLNVSIDPTVLARLNRATGAIEFSVVNYGSSQGQFSTITTNLPTVLADGCSKPTARSQYGAKSLTLVITVDSSGCAANSNSIPILELAASTSTGVIAGVVVAAIVVVAAAIGGIVLWRRQKSNARKREIANLGERIRPDNATELNAVSKPTAVKKGWTSGSKNAALRNTHDE
jgi:hypothetical protein